MRKVWFWLVVLGAIAIVTAIYGVHVVHTVGRP